MNVFFFGRPAAAAHITGGSDAPELTGTVSFYRRPGGTLVTAEICGLPSSDNSGVYGFHIHEGTECVGPDFERAGGHLNPQGRPHPYHAGDLPPLFEVMGGAHLAFVTGRFCVSDIIGKTVIIHSRPDDFKTQPSGNSGSRIACGVIQRTWA